MKQDPSAFPAHVEETVRSTAEIHAEHDRRASMYERIIDGLIEHLARPISIGVLTGGLVLWVATNVTFRWIHHRAFDGAPFPYLQGLVSAAALYVTILILTTQRRENRLAEQRAQMTLQLSMVSEQKIAKLIELIERARRDNPLIADRVDSEAADMAKPVNPQAMFEAFQETHTGMATGDDGVSK